MKTKYSIRALIFLAKMKDGIPVQIKEIAENASIPRKFLELILLDLRNEGILQSKMGKNGGYVLRQPADTISLGKIVRMFDGPLAPVPCVSQTAYAPCKDCPTEKLCVIRNVMKEVRDANAKILDQVTLSSLVEKEEFLISTGGNTDYQI